MARSYQKVPGWTDNGRHTRYAKKQANKRVRRTDDISDGNAYRKVYCSWDICDYRFLEYNPEAYRLKLLQKLQGGYITPEKMIENWYRAWMRK